MNTETEDNGGSKAELHAAGPELCSSAWLDELEAALGHLHKAVLGAAKYGSSGIWRPLNEAHKALDEVNDTERSRSSSEKLSH
ncbi:MAG: hypothetical protein H0X34_17660 [Chthoniobacterales bacterium]|nr:hypothetical protein [Chthoniobacterales bacterium]